MDVAPIEPRLSPVIPRRLGYLSGAPRVSTHRSAGTGGARAHIQGVIEGFLALGWTVETFIVGDRLPDRVRESSTRDMARGTVPRTAVDITRWLWGRFNRRQAWRRFQGRVDLVYERFASFQALGRPFSRRGVPWILEAQGIFFEEAVTERRSMALTRVARRIELNAYRDCDVLVCVSNTLRDRLTLDFGIAPQKVIVVPMAVSLGNFDPAAVRPEADAALRLAFVGELMRWHRLDMLMHAVRDLAEQDGLDIRLDIAGEGLDRTSLESLCDNLGIGFRVRFYGRIPFDEVADFIGRRDLGYIGHAETSERVYSSPTKLYEYMAMAKPVLASGSDDVRALVTEGETGFLFRGGDLDDLKAALRRAYAARGQLCSLGARARELVAANHTWEVRVRQMAQAIDSILSRRLGMRMQGGK